MNSADIRSFNLSVVNRSHPGVQLYSMMFMLGSMLLSYWALLLVPVWGQLSAMHNTEPVVTLTWGFAVMLAFRWLPLQANIVVVPAIVILYMLRSGATHPCTRVRPLFVYWPWILYSVFLYTCSGFGHPKRNKGVLCSVPSVL